MSRVVPLSPPNGPASPGIKTLFNEIAFACMAALGRPCRRTSCALVRHQRAKDAGNITKLKTASSPANNSGSRPALTTLEELANKLGIDAAGLKASVARINAYAQSGTDPDFHRGVTAYQQNLGDADWTGKNPNLGALTQAPYYAVRLYPGDIGACTGLATNADAQVLGANDAPIAGLYAAGNDMHSIMGGVYTAPGITLGPGLVFAYLAARHAAARAGSKP